MIVQLPADKWTQVATAGFGALNAHPAGNVSLLYAMQAAAPAANDLSAGGVFPAGDVIPTVGTDVTTFGLWMRPALPGVG
jgi:hypothetical protein